MTISQTAQAMINFATNEVEIRRITDAIVKQISPVYIYLFGSYAEGRQSEDSDFDFYIVVNDDAENIADLTASAYKAIRSIRTRAVDIVIGTMNRFEQRRLMSGIEQEVYRKGMFLYG